MNLLSNEAIDLLRHNARLVVRELGLLNDAYFDIGVTLAERHLLIELASLPCPTIGEIAERLLLDKSTASRLISKAVKKGYIKCIQDETDKRKRFIQFTAEGKRILETFEPIAFKQSKEALLTLSNEEIDIVYKGVALYAKGLKNSRLKNKSTISPLTQKDYVGLTHLITDHSRKKNWSIFLEQYEEKGGSYFVLRIESKIIGGAGIFPSYEKHLNTGEITNLYLQTDMQGLIFEKMLIEHCLKEAKKRGFNKCYINASHESLVCPDLLLELGFQQSKGLKIKKAILWKAC